MKNEDFPSLYRSADSASLKAQNLFLRFQKVHLASLILGSGIGVFISKAHPSLNHILYTAIAVFLSVGLLMLWVMRSRADEKVWFDGRAIAESVKTATWRFMMNALPFPSKETTEKSFISELKDIREARPHLARILATEMDEQALLITDFIRNLRSKAFTDRRTYYLNNRLGDQKTWYSSKAKSNAKTANFWYWATVFLQSLAVIIVIIQAKVGGFSYNIVPLLITIVATVSAWNQMKKYNELAQSYTIAAQELTELEAISNKLDNEKDFLNLVVQVEEAISREHTMWCARREVFLLRNS